MSGGSEQTPLCERGEMDGRRCARAVELPVPVAGVDGGPERLGCPQCVWSAYLDHARDCACCVRALTPAGQCPKARAYRDALRAVRTIPADGGGEPW